MIKAFREMSIRRLRDAVDAGLRNEHTLLIAGCVALFILFSALSPFFLTFGNIRNLLVQSSIIVPVSVGMTLVIITGEIDLSVASTVTIVGAAAALLMVSGMPVALASVLALALGLGIGLFNGFFSAYVGIPSFMVTLAMLSMGRGGALTITEGGQVAGLPEGFLVIGQAAVGFVPVPLLIAIGAIVLFQHILADTRFGRQLLAIGGNAEAAQVFGLPLQFAKLQAFALCGLLSAISGLVLTARLATASPVVARGLELTVITAVVLGGTSLFGGTGSIVGTALGALIVGTLDNGLNILGVSPFYSQLISGLLIFGVVLIDRLRMTRTPEPGRYRTHDD